MGGSTEVEVGIIGTEIILRPNKSTNSSDTRGVLEAVGRMQYVKDRNSKPQEYSFLCAVMSH